MRILYIFFIGIVIAAQYGCNDSSSSNDSAGNNSVGQNESVTESNDTAAAQESRGPLGAIVDHADVAVHGQIESIDTVYSNDQYGTPHTVVNIKITEAILGDYQDLDSGIISARFVGGQYADGSGREIWASNNPKVAVGEEVVALITEHEDHPCTFTQCAKGLFKVNGNKIIADNGAAVVVDKGHNVKFLSKGAQAKDSHKDLINQGSLANFKSLLAKLAKSSDAKVMARRVTVHKFDKNQPFVASPTLTTASASPMTNEENAVMEAKVKEAAVKQFEKLSAKDQWEVNAVEANGGNPVLGSTFMGEDQQ